MQAPGLKAFRLSVQQARLWALSQVSEAYRVQCAVLLQGRLDIEVFLHAFQCLIDQHDILRTAFYSVPGMEVPLQIVADHTEVCCPVIDMEGLPEEGQASQLDQCFTALQYETFDLEYAPLLYTGMLRFSQETHVLLICLPALCADSSTLTQIVSKLCQTYAGYLEGGSLAEEQLQYADVSAWQNKLLVSEDAAFPRQYWRKIDLSQLASMRLPLERVGNAENYNSKVEQNGKFAPVVLKMPMEEVLLTKIQILAQQHNISTSTLLLTCWQVMLWRLLDGQNFVAGVTGDGRNYEDLTSALGPHSRVVPIGISLADDLPFEQVITVVSKSLQQAIKWQTYFTWETACDTTDNDTASHFFPLSFECDTWPTSFAVGALTASLYRRLNCTEPFALKLGVLQVGERLQLELHYDSRRVAPEDAMRLFSMLHTLLHHVAARLHVPISELPILAQNEQEYLLRSFCASKAALPPCGLHQLFEAQVERVPEQLAVISGSEQLTYRDLNSRSNQLARVLRRRGVGPNVLVGLCVHRSVHMVVGLLAILKADGAYVPLDPDSPTSRLGSQLENMQTPWLLTQQELVSRLPHWGGTVLCLEEVMREMRGEPESNLSANGDPNTMAYVIYTSGSTGTPKGVMVRQRSVVNYTLALGKLLGGKPGWQYATVSTLAADLGNTAIFCALASGGCLQVLDYETITSTEAFARWMTYHPIDVLKIVPSHLSALLASEHARMMLPRRALILGGEALPCTLVERLRKLGGSCNIYNHYGPTETTIGVLVNELGALKAAGEDREPEEESAVVPLGRPINNTEVYVLDRRQQVVPVGMTGELYLGGEGLAIGYLHQPEQTAERFVPHPFGEEEGARLYRTGDLVQYTARGKIEFVGRRDSQVKLRGYRIELGEIETVLRRHPNVRDSAVVLREDAPGEQFLIGYVVAQHQPMPGSVELRDFVQQYLPEYMVPASIMLLEALPLTINGKVDRQQLPSPQPSQGKLPHVVAAPRSPIEEVLLDIWKDLLKVPVIGIHENFFQLGGHSLLATQIVSRIRAVLQVELSILSLFDSPTIAGLAQQVAYALRGGQGVEVPPLVPVPREQDLPLSFAQQRLWFLDQLDPNSTSYNKPVAMQLKGVLNTRALERGLEEMVQRHESLRTTFQVRAGLPLQVIHPAGTFRLSVADLYGLGQEERMNEARRLVEQEYLRPFDLVQGPLLRVSLLWLDAQEHVLLLTLHHIISDGWSNDIFTREVTTLYRAFAAGQPSPLTPFSIQYADFALWQRQWLQGQVLETQLAYWRHQLAGVSWLELPTDHPRPSMQTYRGSFHSVQLPISLHEGLITLCQREGVTLFMLLLAAFQVLLARYTGQNDISVGSPIANRTHAELEGLIGFFVNTLVLRTDLSGDPSFQQLLSRVRETALGAYVHQDVPFELLVEVLRPKRDQSRSPLFQVMFSMVQEASVAMEIQETLNSGSLEKQDSLTSRGGDTEYIATKFDLEVNVVSGEHGLLCGVNYRTDLFDASRMRRLLDHFHMLLEGIIAHPEQKIAQLPLLTLAERHLLFTWNNTQRDYALHRSFPQLFAEQAACTPERIAIVCGNTQLTYQDLDRRANQLAHLLLLLSAGPDLLVGLYMERSVEMVVAMLGIFKAGGAYLPLDPSSPVQRLAFTLQDASVQVVITDPALQPSLPVAAVSVVCLEPTWREIDGYSEKPPPLRNWPEQLAYVIYTSGSTGQPKGAMVTQVGMLNHLYAKIETLQLSSSDIVAQTASHCFDISVWQFLATLLLGGQVRIFPDEITHDPVNLFIQVGVAHGTIMEVVPSLLRAFLDTVEQPPPDRNLVANLRWLIATGEMLSTGVSLRWMRRYPQVPLLNAYGPTECSDDVTHALLRPSLLEETMSAPIGQAIANMQIYIVDDALELVPLGVLGQIYVGGIGVGRGYLGDATRTAAVFVPDPFGQQVGGRLYKTGDVGRYRENGQIEFVRRIDQQVKVRGYRIELGEIEAVLEHHPAVREGVVLVREDAPGDQRLVAYVVGREVEVAPADTRLRSYLQEKLPSYMVPASIMVLDALPLTPNGKVDRGALPTPEPWRTELEKEALGTSTPIEELLLGIWGEVLGCPQQIGIHDNFFDLGGHSLLATQLFSRVRATLQVEVPLRSLFEAPTIAELAQQVEHALRAGLDLEAPPLVPVSRTQDLPLSFAQQRLWFIDQLEPGNVAYTISVAVRLRGTLNVAALERSIYELIRRHESLRTVFRMKGDQPVQVIKDIVRVCLPLTELSILLPEQRELEARRLAQQEIHQPFDLAQGPVLRTTLLRSIEEEHVLLLSMHHIISDGWSMNVLVHELSSLYSAFITGESSHLPELPIQYADFAYWQRQWLQGDVLEARLEYWTRQLGGNTPLRLPTDHPRLKALSYRGADYPFTLSPTLSKAIAALSRQEGVTLFMALLAAFQTLLYRYTGQIDIIVGTDIANRTHVETEGLIGFFINLLVLRNDLSGTPTFRELLKRTREMVLGAYTHQDTPFEMLVERLLPDHSLDRMPLVQVLFVLQNLPSTQAQLPEIHVSPFVSTGATTAKFDLALFMLESPQGLRGIVKYSSDLFEERTIASIMSHFEVLLRNSISHPDTPIDVLDYYTDAEKTRQTEQSKNALRKLSLAKGREIQLSGM